MSTSSFRLNAFRSAAETAAQASWSSQMMYATAPMSNSTLLSMDFGLSAHGAGTMSTGGGHLSLGSLMLLVSEAVLEVVCVSLPGYIVARMGMFDTENQKFVANLNVYLFTPCLIFTKLASQLTLSKIVELGVIPVIFAFMTVVSYLCSLAVAKIFRFDKRAKNFVIAMGVFGNSNSLPISLVLSLSMTISGLHWDRIPGDNDGEVGARGILYLLIFQQLGQLLRWSWGYHVLLAPAPNDDPAPDGPRYRDDELGGEDSNDPLHVTADPFSPHFQHNFDGLHQVASEIDGERGPLLPVTHQRRHYRTLTSGTTDSAFESQGPSGQRTPISSYPSSHPSSTSLAAQSQSSHTTSVVDYGVRGAGDLTSFPSIKNFSPSRSIENALPRWSVPSTPTTVSSVLAKVKKVISRFLLGLWEFMNPPLWAMLAAVIVASIPQLQALFFTKGTFIQTSVTRAVAQSGNVAVPLILVVLGANLANSTSSTNKSEHADKHETRLLIASLISRMLLPFLIIGPALAVCAKYLGISILDDPIFVIVCYLLAGAPSALQLAQICQINCVYEDVITRVLFWSYVVVILPSTLVLVITAIEVVHWAN